MTEKIHRVFFFAGHNPNSALIITSLLILTGLPNERVTGLLLSALLIMLTGEFIISEFQKSRERVRCDHCYDLMEPDEVIPVKLNGDKNNPVIFICKKGVQTGEYTVCP
jgi:hypothetical protein